MISLYDLIKSSEQNKEAKIKIIEKFSPLLNKYSKKLDYEYAKTDLVIALLEIIQSLSKLDKLSFTEGTLVKYIATSMYHSYIYLS